MRYCTSVLLLFLCLIFTENQIAAKGRHVSVQKYRSIPGGYRVAQPACKKYNANGADIFVYSQGFRQGDACYLEFLPEADVSLKPVIVELLYFSNNSEQSYEVILNENDWGYNGLFPIHPETRPGRQLLRVIYSVDGKRYEKKYPCTIVQRDFEESRNVLRFRKYNTGKPMSEKTKRYIATCSKIKKAAFSRETSLCFDEKLAHPRGMHYITSSFWKRRRYIGYIMKNGEKKRLIDSIKIHRGLDLRGKRGTPVYAIARGRVVVAQEMYYEGNMLILDHGHGVFSYYMHLHAFHADTGSTVEAGSRIATVGSTGRSTAPHLHVSVLMRGVQVDPLSMLSLPVR